MTEITEKAEQLQSLVDRYWAIQKMPDGAPDKAHMGRVLAQIKEISVDEYLSILFRLAEDCTKDGRQLDHWNHAPSYKQRLKLMQRIYETVSAMKNGKQKRAYLARIKAGIQYLPSNVGPGLAILKQMLG